MYSKGNKNEILKDIKFRMAEKEDAQRLVEIYAPYVTDTAITFEYEVPSVEEFAQRIEHISEKYPYVVCMYKDDIVGYAYAHEYAEREAYQWNVESSIYLDMNYKSLGIGAMLYKKIIEIVKLQNFENIYACITSANEKSLKFHEKLGFKFVGIFEDTGYKFGKWYGTVWLGIRLGDKNNQPKPIKGINEIEASLIEAIFEN